ncbi:fructose-bisphosphatase class II [Dendrosporobacter quercicolus]|nr:fructose-bisphosphatase class II [Dendrosporobacter quercicolus]
MALEFVRVTEAAALVSGRWMSKGEKCRHGTITAGQGGNKNSSGVQGN